MNNLWAKMQKSRIIDNRKWVVSLAFQMGAIAFSVIQISFLNCDPPLYPLPYNVIPGILCIICIIGAIVYFYIATRTR